MQFDSLINNLVWIGSLFLVNLFVGLISLPFTSLFFKKFSDKGYSVSAPLGFIFIAYLVFTLVTLKILPLNIFIILLITLMWGGFNALIQYKFSIIDLKNFDWKQLIKINISFVVFFLIMYVIKSYQAEIYQIERFMDYGFIKALFNSETLPLKDIWFSGENLNYYYFSHFVGFIILSLTRIPLEPGFYILTSWIFATVGINIFRIGKDIGRLLSLGTKTFSFIAGSIAVFWGIFGGVLHSVLWISETFKQTNNEFLAGWYAEPTRVIAGTITEIPIYTYIVAELHPHMWGAIIGVIVMSLIVCFWLSRETVFNMLQKNYWLLAFLLGVAFMMNSWDIVTLGTLSAIAIFSKILLANALGDGKSYKFINLWHNILKNNRLLLFVLVSLALLPLLAVGFAMPWKYFFEAPVTGIGKVKEISDLAQWFSFWGQFVIILVLFLNLTIFSNLNKKFYKNFWKNLMNANKGITLIILFALATILFWIVIENIYVKDILLEGEWYRANTFFKVTSQIWLWLSVITGPMVVYILSNTKGRFNSKVVFFILWLVFSISSIYPVKAIWQGGIAGKQFKGIENGLSFWKNKYPDDYEAYLYLEDVRKKLPEAEKMKIIIEADGDSYKDNNYFSVFLGWQSVVGWPVHEWTWRGSYDPVGKRRTDVVEVYTGESEEKARDILEKYNVDYIIVGQIEKEKYTDRINYGKLNSLGRSVYQNDGTKIILVE